MNHIISQDMEELVKRPGIDWARLKGSTVLVAGGNSLLGKCLVWLFCYLNEEKDFGITLYVLVRNLEKAQESYKAWVGHEYFNILHQDICDPLDMASKGAPRQIDYLFHFAGSASARLIAQDPTGIIKANTLGTIRVLDLARTMQARNVVFASTREVYGRLPEDVTLIKETDMGVLDPLLPRNSYPESKKAAEALFVAYTQQFGVPSTILRIAHTYGPGMAIDNDGRIMADIIGAVVRKEDIVITSDGTARRSFCYITDCLDGMVRAMLSDSGPTGSGPKVFNLANETEPYMIKEVAQMAADSFPGLNLKVSLSPEGEGAFKGGYNPLPLVQLDTGRIASLGWKPLVPLQEGLRRTVASFW